ADARASTPRLAISFWLGMAGTAGHILIQTGRGGDFMELQIYRWGDPGQYGTYQAAIRRAGGEPLLSRDVGAASGCAGLLLPGGGDVAPWRYGQRNLASRSIEPERDAAEW